MYNLPHLIKNIRNNLHKHGLELDGKKLLWSHIKEFYNADTAYPVLITSKLKEKHVYLPPFTALSVRLATQVLSHTFAYITGYIVRKIGKKCCQPCNEKIGARVDDDNPNHELIQEKSYGKLQAPSQSLLGLVQLLELRYRKVITNIISKENVKSHLSHELSKVLQLQLFKCDHCHQHLLIVHIMINIRLHHSIREMA